MAKEWHGIESLCNAMDEHGREWQCDAEELLRSETPSKGYAGSRADRRRKGKAVQRCALIQSSITKGGMTLNWTPEELREMAAADAAIDSEIEVDMELSRRLDQAALDDRLDAKHLHKLQWQRAYYQANKETILRQNRESKERAGYKPVRDKDRERARMHDYYERNKGKWDGYKEAKNRRFHQCDEFRAHTLEIRKQKNRRNGARRRERMATDPEYRERINAQKRDAYRRRVESDPGYREMLNEKRRQRKKKAGDANGQENWNKNCFQM